MDIYNILLQSLNDNDNEQQSNFGNDDASKISFSFSMKPKCAKHKMTN